MSDQKDLVGLRMTRALETLDAALNLFEQGDSSMLEVLETLLTVLTDRTEVREEI
ncbi:hypothetical protein B7760_05902 (plasmid) [Burkholderia glumae]|nr:hypothetical protein [Burkholderia glumae]QKM51824.1 hypothetical protein B7760_05902 [Burkholderia glumae]